MNEFLNELMSVETEIQAHYSVVASTSFQYIPFILFFRWYIEKWIFQVNINVPVTV